MTVVSMLFDYRCQVVDQRPCGPGLWVLRLKPVAGQPPFACRAGQFVMLDLPTEQFFFRRPFSVLEVGEDGTFALYYKVVGVGTNTMADFRPGQDVRCLGPLGSCFTPTDPSEKTLLIGGGIGIAPLYLLGKQAQAGAQRGAPTEITCFYGIRSAAEIGLEAELTQVLGAENLHVATDDGSQGFHGNVCQALAAQPEVVQQASRVYVCGPSPMMAAAVRLLNKMNPAIHIETSLEMPMPCGTGACFGCVVVRSDGAMPSRVCLEGPVFNAAVLNWGDRGPMSPNYERPGVGNLAAAGCGGV